MGELTWGTWGSDIIMNSIHIILSFLFTSVSAIPTWEGRAETLDHPGCAILWFLPDCPLTRVMGVDPFNIYPWDKLCREYSALAKHQVCKEQGEKKEVKKVEEKKEKSVGRMEQFSLSRNLKTEDDFTISRSRNDL